MYNKNNAAQVSHPFSPIGDGHSRVLILGTFPSVQSRRAAFYYAHPRNRFWRVLADCFEFPPPENTDEKTLLLLKNGVALWDVLASCEISGSDDASIRRPVLNDIAAFIKDKPIAKILCNGQKAYQLYCRHCAPTLPAAYMPSTSPANAAWSVERLTAVWLEELNKAASLK